MSEELSKKLEVLQNTLNEMKDPPKPRVLPKDWKGTPNPDYKQPTPEQKPEDTKKPEIEIPKFGFTRPTADEEDPEAEPTKPVEPSKGQGQAQPSTPAPEGTSGTGGPSKGKGRHVWWDSIKPPPPMTGFTRKMILDKHGLRSDSWDVVDEGDGTYTLKEKEKKTGSSSNINLYPFG